jgi:UDP-N-acetyl-D-glucosamine dehydrogenase
VTSTTTIPERAPDEAGIARLVDRFRHREAQIGIIGLGYVGLPLCMAIAESGSTVIGFDIDDHKIRRLAAGESYIQHVAPDKVSRFVNDRKFAPTSDFSRLRDADAILICVPTPLTRHFEPDLSFVVSTARSIAAHLRPKQLIVLESTTYPTTTRDVVKPILESTGLVADRDFYLAFSPEREDPGNPHFTTERIAKIVGGLGEASLRIATALYDSFVVKTIAVSSAETAEAVKLTENIFRAVNIALVNELKIIYNAMGIDIWEVIDAAKTKPFGFMPFYPGPGLGGHCIPIDPFYLTWKAREYGIATRFIELAGQINRSMPEHVVGELALNLDRRQRRGLNGSTILLLGIAYKRNVDDVRESPALTLMEILEKRGADVSFFDPHIAVIPMTREHSALANRRSIAWDLDQIKNFDVVLIATDHDDVDYQGLVGAAKLVVDTRNVCGRAGIIADHIIKA